MGRDGKPFRPFVTAGHHLRHPRKTRSLSAQFQPLRIGNDPRPGIAERQVVPTPTFPHIPAAADWDNPRSDTAEHEEPQLAAFPHIPAAADWDNPRPETAEREVVLTRSVSEHSSRCGLGTIAPRNCGARGCPNSQRFRTFQPLRIETIRAPKLRSASCPNSQRIRNFATSRISGSIFT